MEVLISSINKTISEDRHQSPLGCEWVVDRDVDEETNRPDLARGLRLFLDSDSDPESPMVDSGEVLAAEVVGETLNADS